MNFKNVFAGVFAAGLIALGGVSASALSITGVSDDLQEGAGVATLTDNGGGNASIDFDWTATAYQHTVSFTTDFAFDFFFTDYRNDTADVGLSGFVLVNVDTNTIVSEDDITCGASSPFGGPCQLIAESDSIDSPLAPLASAPDAALPLFAELEAGSYLLGVRDSSVPNPAGVSFAIAAVPLPAGLVLFLSGLGILGFVSRRKA